MKDSLNLSHATTLLVLLPELFNDDAKRLNASCVSDVSGSVLASQTRITLSLVDVEEPVV